MDKLWSRLCPGHREGVIKAPKPGGLGGCPYCRAREALDRLKILAHFAAGLADEQSSARWRHNCEANTAAHEQYDGERAEWKLPAAVQEAFDLLAASGYRVDGKARELEAAGD